MSKLMYYPPTMSVFAEDYKTARAYLTTLKDCRKHYGYSARVEGGWKFFEFEDDYTTWKKQR